MKKFPYKIIISALWLMEIIAFIAYRTLALNQNAHNASLLKNEELLGYLIALMTFAFLTLILKNQINRRTNIIAGFVMGGVQIIMFIDGFVEYSITDFNLITGTTIVSTFLILCFAYNWPKKSL